MPSRTLDAMELGALARLPAERGWASTIQLDVRLPKKRSMQPPASMSAVILACWTVLQAMYPRVRHLPWK